MSQAQIALVGDPTTTGGQIISGDPTFFCDGSMVARQGDKAVCGVCKQAGTILNGAQHWMQNGAPIAYNGCIVACDCRPIGVNRIIAVRSRMYIHLTSDTGYSSPAPTNNMSHSTQPSSPQVSFAGGQNATASKRDDERNESLNRLLGEDNVRYREVKESYHLSQRAVLLVEGVWGLGSFAFKGDYIVDRYGNLSISGMGFTAVARLDKVEFQLVAHIYVDGKEVMHKRLTMSKNSSAWPADDNFIPIGDAEIKLPAARKNTRVQLCLKGTYYYITSSGQSKPTTSPNLLHADASVTIKYFDLRTEIF